MPGCPEFGTSQIPFVLVAQLSWDITGMHGQELEIAENNKVHERVIPKYKIRSGFDQA